MSNENVFDQPEDLNKNKTGFVNLGFENLNDEFNVNSKDKTTKKDVDTTKQDVEFDDLLPIIGDFGRYQKILFLLLAPFTLFFAFVYFAQIFITLIPDDYWCNVPELQHLSLSERLNLSIPLIDGEFSKCTMYAVNYTELLSNNVNVADPSWPTQSCIFGFEFDQSEIAYTTIATELGWVCENDALPTIAQSVFFCGAITGGLLFGWIADRFGRVPALIGANVVGGIAGIVTAYANSFWAFTLCRYFAGFAFDNCFTIMFILALEYVGPQWRTFVANMCTAIYFGFGALIMPWIAFWINDWKTLTIATSSPMLFAIFTPWLVPESARWLISQDQMDKATKLIHKFERINKKPIDSDVFQRFIETTQRMNAETKNQTYSLLDLFRTPRLRKITLLMIVIYMCSSLVFDGFVRNITSVGLNVFIAFTLVSATEFPASLLLTLLLDRWGRRWFLFGTLVLCSICSLVLAFTISGNVIVSVAFMMAGRFFINFAYNIAQQYAAEVLPTVVRVQGVAFIHNLGYVANIISPLIVYLQTVNAALPFGVLVIVALLGGSSILFLPETMGTEFAQTLEDGEKFGLDQKFWDMPCRKKPRTDSIGD